MMSCQFILASILVATARAGVIPTGPAFSYSSAPALSYAPHIPAIQYAAAPALRYQAAPAINIAHTPAFSVAHAPALTYAAAAPAVAVARAEPYDAHPRYHYRYGVSDLHTGDQKTAEETRDGDLVQGSYSVAEPDGTVRTVKYAADSHSGFNAIVEKSGHAVHPAPAPVAVHAAPVAVHAAPVSVHAAPLSIAAPALHAAPLSLQLASHSPLLSYKYH